MRTVRRKQAGFSLIEALIAAVVLGVGLVGLARLHITSIQGTLRSDDTGRAAEVARGMADRFATLPWSDLPACGNPNNAPTWVNPPTPGCQASTNQFNPVAPGGGCTVWYREDGIPDVNDGTWIGPADQDPFHGDGSAPDTGNFLIHVTTSAHPLTADFPTVGTAGPGEQPVQVVWVWVCYRDMSGLVHEVSANRVMTQGL